MTGQGIDLDYLDIKWFALEMNSSHSVVFEIASKYCISDSVFDYDGYSIYSKGFLPTVIDTMVIKKIRDTKGTFHAKMGTIKDRNGMALKEAEDIKKRWQEYTELYKKDLHDPDNHDGMITHLEPDILECKVKWALWAKPEEVIEFQLSYFKS